MLIFVAPCDEAPCHSSVLLVVFVDASNNEGVVGKLLKVAETRVETEVSGVESEEKLH